MLKLTWNVLLIFPKFGRISKVEVSHKTIKNYLLFNALLKTDKRKRKKKRKILLFQFRKHTHTYIYIKLIFGSVFCFGFFQCRKDEKKLLLGV